METHIDTIDNHQLGKFKDCTHRIFHDDSEHEKFMTGIAYKMDADREFEENNVKAAIYSYHLSLLYASGLSGKKEADKLIENIYANLSACHIIKEGWEFAVMYANNALKKNPGNYKAMFRKARALGQLGEHERAVKVLEELKKQNPSEEETADAELNRLAIIENKRRRVYEEPMKGFFNKTCHRITPERN